MAELNLGILKASFGEIRDFVTWPLRFVVGTDGIRGYLVRIDAAIARIEGHSAAMVEVLQILVADASGKWTAEQRLEVQRHIANFGAINQGLAEIRPSGNPISASEIALLQSYVSRAQRGETFTPKEAAEFTRLSEIAANEHPKEDWTRDLLKLSMIVGGLYLLAQIFKKS